MAKLHGKRLIEMLVCGKTEFEFFCNLFCGSFVKLQDVHITVAQLPRTVKELSEYSMVQLHMYLVTYRYCYSCHLQLTCLVTHL